MNDLRDIRDDIIRQMRDGFEGVHERQDRTNGRIDRLETHTDAITARTAVLESQSVHLHRRSDDPPGAVTAAEKAAITRREVSLVLLGVGGGIGVLKFLTWIIPALQVLAR